MLNGKTSKNPLSLKNCIIQSIAKAPHLLTEMNQLPKSLLNDVMVFKTMWEHIRHYCEKCLSLRLHVYNTGVDLGEILPYNYKFCMNCIQNFKSRLSMKEYSKIISYLMDEYDTFWYSFMANVVHCIPANMLYWNFQCLTLDQALALKNHPNTIPEFCDEIVKIRINAFFCKKKQPITINKIPKCNFYCLPCAIICKQQYKCPEDILITRITSTNFMHSPFINPEIVYLSNLKLLNDILYCEKFWCKRCERIPLFEIICNYDSNEAYRMVDDWALTIDYHADCSYPWNDDSLCSVSDDMIHYECDYIQL